MNKILLFIPFFFIGLATSSQSLNVGSESSISISENAILTVENASFYGAFENEGDLFINQSVDFLNNRHVGNITFVGSQPSVVSGGNLFFNSLTTNSEANIILTSDSLFTNKLSLQSGIIVTGFSYFKSQEDIEGGSDLSHIEGTLLVEKQTTGDQNFPLGKNGLYNPLRLSSVPQGSLTSVKINVPNEAKLFPSDSIIGINKQFEWEINYSGTLTSTTPSIQFQGIDLSDLPNRVEIKAPIYVPIIARFDTISNTYKTLGIGSIEDTDNNTFGTIEAASAFKLESNPIILTIALAPTTDKLHFYVPNFFSPNAQLEENKIFRPFLVGKKVTELNLKIWDQYNRLVFTENYLNPDMNLIGWTGDDEPEGIYFFRIELKSEGGTFNQQGTVFLAR